MMEIPDLTNLPVTSIVALALIVAALDVLISSALAVIKNAFDVALMMTYLRTHVLARVFPILALALVGHGVDQLGVPAIPAASLAAGASLALYAIETLGSLRDSFKGQNTPT